MRRMRAFPTTLVGAAFLTALWTGPAAAATPAIAEPKSNFSIETAAAVTKATPEALDLHELPWTKKGKGEFPWTKIEA